MTQKPSFINNLNDNTLARALRTILDRSDKEESGKSISTPDQVRIATAFFSPAGFAYIADQLASINDVRLLLGATFAVNALGEQKLLTETPEMFERRKIESGLRQMSEKLKLERDYLPFTLGNRKTLQNLVELLRTANIKVRRYEKAFLHAKAYIFTSADECCDKYEGVIAGSSNLTGGGLVGNLELNLGCYDYPLVNEARQWFDDLWEDAEPYDLAELFEEALELWRPWEIFIRVLWNLYGHEVKEDEKAYETLPLTNFQKHGVARALRLISETGGVIVADEVGLGKSFIAGEILQIYHDRRQRALLICPASLRDSTWRKFISEHQLYVECLSFEQLANDTQLGDLQHSNANRNHLQRPLSEYQLIIVDEAHNYRNPNTPSRAAVLRRLLFGQPRDLLLLTATPVNNSLWDLYHLIRFFIRQDARFSDRGILSIRARFEQAMREDPSSISPDTLYPIIDATTVKRTRQFVQKHYANDVIKCPDGTRQPIVFPQPNAISVRYNLEELLPGLFDLLEQALDPDNSNSIAFARYVPDEYLLDKYGEEEAARSSAIVGLLCSGLLKRFESSVFAFCKTVKKMLDEHDSFLNAINSGYIVTTAFMKELSADDEALFEDLLSTTENKADAVLYDIKALREAVECDRSMLQMLYEKVASTTCDQDPKLRALEKSLIEILQQAENEASDAIDERQKRKVLVFSGFEHTVEWIRDFLKTKFDIQPDLSPYQGRMVAVSSSGNLADVSRQQAVQGFAPVSMQAPEHKDNDLYDIMISTDVLAEGVNLQQCRHIINFDMPWNPMRLIQRHGRIDRIGSPHGRVYLRTVFPADRLDRLLSLEQRILEKLAMAAASIGVRAPIEGSAQGAQVFTETRAEIEKLLKEDATLYERGGTVSAAQTGEEYRQTLRMALAQNENWIHSMPWKVGSMMSKGTQRGVFFCAVIGVGTKYKRTYLRFIKADDEWQVRTDGKSIEREVGICLRLIECDMDAQICHIDFLKERVYEFWKAARDDIHSSWMWETDPANLQPKLRPLNRQVAEFIRANTPLDTQEDKIKRALDILESPWPRREEMMLRDWFKNEVHESATSLTRFLIDKILETGLEPGQPLEPLPPINSEDIKLLCWMGIEQQEDIT